jgi:hypothetical protein
MMRKLIVFTTCQRTDSSITAEIFHRHGMSLGQFSFFQATPEKPLGLCEAMPIFQIDHTLHRIIYGFGEDSIHYELAGRIMKNREFLRPDIGQIRHDFIGHGIETIQNLVTNSPISGFKHPASALFWFYWQHVFSRIPDLEIHPIFLLRPPNGIAASYARRAHRPEFQNAMFDLIEIYLNRMLEIYQNWHGSKNIIRFTDEHYQSDLQTAIENCGLQWNKKIYEQNYQASATVQIDDLINHPVQKLYDLWLTHCSIK